MAFTRPDLVQLQPGGPGGGIVAYATDDGLATVQNANYFGPAAAQLPVGTRILLTVLKSTTPAYRKAAVSLSNPATGALNIVITAGFA